MSVQFEVLGGVGTVVEGDVVGVVRFTAVEDTDRGTVGVVVGTVVTIVSAIENYIALYFLYDTFTLKSLSRAI